MTANKPMRPLMEHLFVVRHGSYDKDGRLDHRGREQIVELSNVVKEILGKGRIQMLSSSADRARESAETLASELGVKNVETFDYLWSGKNSPWRRPYGDMNAIHLLVTQRRYLSETLFLVTHTEVSRDYPEYFTRQEFGRDARFDELFTGEAHYLNVSAMEWKTLPRGTLTCAI